MTPLELSILIHACVSAAVHPNRGAPAVEEAIRSFIEKGAIELCDEANMIRATPMGKAWLRACCRIQAPSQAWIDSSGEVIA